MRKLFLYAALFFVPYDVIVSQQPTRATDSYPTLRERSSAASKVVIDAVAPRSKHPAEKIEPNVTIFDNGVRVPQQLLTYPTPAEAHDAAQLILILDAINSSTKDLQLSKTALKAFLGRNQGVLQQRTSILVLTTTSDPAKSSGAPSQAAQFAVVQQKHLSIHRIPPTTDGYGLAASLDAFPLATSSDGGAAGASASERVRLSLTALSDIATEEAREAGPKVTVWLSEGWPYVDESTAKPSPQVFDAIVYFSDLIRTARMIMYMIDPRGVVNQDTSASTEAFLLASRPGSVRAIGHAPVLGKDIGLDFYKSFTKGVSDSSMSNPNDLALQVLAIQSGGDVLELNNDIFKLLVECSSNVSRIVTIAYSPPQATQGHLAYHQISVRNVDSKPYKARTGFYAR